MSLLRLINVQGYISLATSLVLSAVLALTVIKADHWHDTAISNENLYHAEQAAHRQTVINYQTAAEKARKADAENKARVEREQAAISHEREATYEARIADARARAERLRVSPQTGADQRSPGGAPVSHLPGPPIDDDVAPAEGRLPPSDALIATEQAIQLDELIKWIKDQVQIDVGSSSSSPNGNH